MSEPDGNKLVRVDMHCHTRLSKDSLNDPRKLVEMAAARGIHVLCVTDHNGLANALALSKMDGLPTRVIPSEEVKSNEGEIIGYFLSELVPKGMTPEETARRIRGQGGLVAVPHPFDSLRTASRLRTPALERLVEAGLVDIIEVLNARSIQVEDNARALEFARKHDLAMSAGSDAHTLIEIGRAHVEMPDFSGPEQMLRSLRQGTIEGQLSSKFIHIGSTWARVAKSIPFVGGRFQD
ncbi:MAG TPA: PHP domain-containing protein [Chloroflexia bacterium]|nr:PHP domain-containing protein [Chloroflexia bacterium]